MVKILFFLISMIGSTAWASTAKVAKARSKSPVAQQELSVFDFDPDAQPYFGGNERQINPEDYVIVDRSQGALISPEESNMLHKFIQKHQEKFEHLMNKVVVISNELGNRFQISLPDFLAIVSELATDAKKFAWLQYNKLIQEMSTIDDTDVARMIKIQFDLAMIELLKQSSDLAREYLSKGVTVADFLKKLENEQRLRLEKNIE